MSIHDIIDVLAAFRDNKKIQFKEKISDEIWIDLNGPVDVVYILSLMSRNYWLRIKPIPREWWQIRGNDKEKELVSDFLYEEAAKIWLNKQPDGIKERFVIVHVIEVID